MTPCQATCCN